MQEITLPQEEFAAKALLADIGTQVSKGRAELALLQEQKTSFFHEQELELMQRLQLLLDNSQEMLKLVDYNHLTLQGYSNELTAFATELSTWHEKILATQEEFLAEKARYLSEFDAKMADLSTKTEGIRMQYEAINATRREQDKRTLELNARETAINDKYMQLMKTTQRLKK